MSRCISKSIRGMGRLGVRAEQVEEVLALLYAVRSLPRDRDRGHFHALRDGR